MNWFRDRSFLSASFGILRVCVCVCLTALFLFYCSLVSWVLVFCSSLFRLCVCVCVRILPSCRLFSFCASPLLTRKKKKKSSPKHELRGKRSGDKKVRARVARRGEHEKERNGNTSVTRHPFGCCRCCCRCLLFFLLSCYLPFSCAFFFLFLLLLFHSFNVCAASSLVDLLHVLKYICTRDQLKKKRNRCWRPHPTPIRATTLCKAEMRENGVEAKETCHRYTRSD